MLLEIADDLFANTSKFWLILTVLGPRLPQNPIHVRKHTNEIKPLKKSM
jgi:hypothetical protein